MYHSLRPEFNWLCDFRVAGRLLEVPFNNLYSLELMGRGGWIEATHGRRTFGFLLGQQTLQAGVGVPLRLETPQRMAGAYIRQQAGEHLLLGARILLFSTDLDKLRQTPYLSVSTNPLRSARSAAFSALYKLPGRLQWYGEAALSEGSRAEPVSGGNPGRLSLTTGPLWETDRLTVRANYVYQTDSYLPLLGYSLGDRRGTYGEIKLRPHSRLEIYGSASDYANNVAHDPLRPTFRSESLSGGASVQLPSRFSLGGQWSLIQLASRKSDIDPRATTTSEQMQITLTRPLKRHSLRIAARQFEQRGQLLSQRQRTVEVADVTQYRWFSAGAEIRAQQLIGDQSKRSIYARVNRQINIKRLSAYANIESGNDLANRTLFATNTLSTTVVGGAVRLWGDWSFSAEAFRSKLLTKLNEQNVFVLQGQGVVVPVVLSSLNQWSLHFQMTKRFQWGQAIDLRATRLDDYARGQNPLRGSVEGFVTQEAAEGSPRVEGIPVTLDGTLTALTDAGGRFRFEGVGEGAHKVGLAMSVLSADYNPGANRERTIFVKPAQLSRADLDVVAVGYSVQGRVQAPEGGSIGAIVIRLLPTERYTTTDLSGRFSFYNVRLGNYEVALAEETLPQYALLATPAKVKVKVSGSGSVPLVHFQFDVHIPSRPVRKVLIAVAPTNPSPPPAVIRKLAIARDVKPEQPPSTEVAPKSTPALAPEKNVSNATALYERRRLLTQRGDFHGAATALNAAIEMKPNFPLAYNARGYARLRLLKYSEAALDFTEAIRGNSAYSNAYHNRAAARRALGDRAGADADLAREKSLQ